MPPILMAFFIACIGSTICVDDYIVSLTAPSDNVNRVTYLTDHISNLDSMLNGDYFVKHVYSYLAEFDFYAYAVSLSSVDADIIRHMTSVKFIELVGYMNVAGVRKIGNSIPFDPQYMRPETPTLTRDGFCNIGYDTYNSFVQDFNGNMDMTDIRVFVLDTGIQAEHDTFGGRVEHGIDLINPQQPPKTDPHGHGTQIAGIIGGRYQGVAKNVHLVDVRVMDEQGRGRVDDIIAGLNYVVGRFLALRETEGPLNSIACMSMNGSPSKALRHALFFISKALLVVTSLGEHDSFSCSYSPMDSPYIVTVGALQRVSELEIPGANFGDCVDLYAPGEDIPAPWIGDSNSAESFLTGSSASAAIVAGMAVHLMAGIRNPNIKYPATGQTIHEEMLRHVEAGQYVMFMRNILLGSRADARQAMGVSSTNKVVNFHAGPSIYCDIRSQFDIPRFCITQIETLHRINDRPKVFQKVKSNMAYHSRKMAEEFYS